MAIFQSIKSAFSSEHGKGGRDGPPGSETHFVPFQTLQPGQPAPPLWFYTVHRAQPDLAAGLTPHKLVYEAAPLRELTVAETMTPRFVVSEPTLALTLYGFDTGRLLLVQHSAHDLQTSLLRYAWLASPTPSDAKALDWAKFLPDATGRVLVSLDSGRFIQVWEPFGFVGGGGNQVMLQSLDLEAVEPGLRMTAWAQDAALSGHLYVGCSDGSVRVLKLGLKPADILKDLHQVPETPKLQLVEHVTLPCLIDEALDKVKPGAGQAGGASEVAHLAVHPLYRGVLLVVYGCGKAVLADVLSGGKVLLSLERPSHRVGGRQALERDRVALLDWTHPSGRLVVLIYATGGISVYDLLRYKVEETPYLLEEDAGEANVQAKKARGEDTAGAKWEWIVPVLFPVLEDTAFVQGANITQLVWTWATHVRPQLAHLEADGYSKWNGWLTYAIRDKAGSGSRLISRIAQVSPLMASGEAQTPQSLWSGVALQTQFGQPMLGIALTRSVHGAAWIAIFDEADSDTTDDSSYDVVAVPFLPELKVEDCGPLQKAYWQLPISDSGDICWPDAAHQATHTAPTSVGSAIESPLSQDKKSEAVASLEENEDEDEDDSDAELTAEQILAELTAETAAHPTFSDLEISDDEEQAAYSGTSNSDTMPNPVVLFRLPLALERLDQMGHFGSVPLPSNSLPTATLLFPFTLQATTSSAAASDGWPLARLFGRKFFTLPISSLAEYYDGKKALSDIRSFDMVADEREAKAKARDAELAKAARKGNTTAAATTDPAFADTKDKLTQRGEHLDELGSKSAKMETSSKNLLDTLKAHNQKYKNKWFG